MPNIIVYTHSMIKCSITCKLYGIQLQKHWIGHAFTSMHTSVQPLQALHRRAMYTFLILDNSVSYLSSLDRWSDKSCSFRLSLSSTYVHKVIKYFTFMHYILHLNLHMYNMYLEWQNPLFMHTMCIDTEYTSFLYM